ncbi:MAG: IPT/TIG domain-containing protein [Planctomycetota bacterium]
MRPIIALNPKVVPYMRPGHYELTVLFENPERPEFGADGVRVQLRLNFPGFPEITSVANAASLQPGISPGQLVTIRGAHLSSPPVIGEADSAGLFPTVIGHTRVRFNGIPAPLLYVSTEQINCVVPHGVAGSRTAQVVVELTAEPAAATIRSSAVTVPVSDTSPGIFTADQSGSGPGAILNTGPGTGFNAESNPAPRGTAITFYGTGAGAWNVAYPDGGLVLASRLGLAPPSPEFLAPLAPVSVTIGGQPARVVAATAQSMRVSGMLQVTAEIAEGIGSGPRPVVLKVGDNDNAEQNVTVWVR